jgi:hypothetical protein
LKKRTVNKPLCLADYLYISTQPKYINKTIILTCLNNS